MEQDRKVKAPERGEVWELAQTNRKRTRREIAARAVGPAVEDKIAAEWAAWENDAETVADKIGSLSKTEGKG